MPKTTTTEITTIETGLVPELRALALEIASPDEDPTERMMAFVASHPPEEWDALWASLPNLQDNPGRAIRVEALRAMPSDFEGPLGVYLICEGTWLDSGERTLLTCSSTMGLCQLLVLYKNGRLPADLEIVRKEKATRRGFHPIHFRYLDRAQVAKQVS